MPKGDSLVGALALAGCDGLPGIVRRRMGLRVLKWLFGVLLWGSRFICMGSSRQPSRIWSIDEAALCLAAIHEQACLCPIPALNTSECSIIQPFHRGWRVL